MSRERGALENFCERHSTSPHGNASSQNLHFLFEKLGLAAAIQARKIGRVKYEPFGGMVTLVPD